MTAAARHRHARQKSDAVERSAIRNLNEALGNLETALTRSAALARDLLNRTDPPKEPDHG